MLEVKRIKPNVEWIPHVFRDSENIGFYWRKIQALCRAVKREKTRDPISKNIEARKYLEFTSHHSITQMEIWRYRT